MNSAEQVLQGMIGRPACFINTGAEHRPSGGLGPRLLTIFAESRGLESYFVNLGGRKVRHHLRSLTGQIPPNAVVGLTAISGAPLARCIEVASYLRNTREDVSLVWGGPHCLQYPELTSQSGLADLVVCGDGEPFVQALTGCSMNRCLARMSPPNVNPSCPIIWTRVLPCLDMIPVLTDHVSAEEASYKAEDSGAITYETVISRGCYCRCAFCCVGSEIMGPYRVRSVQHVSRELASVAAAHIEQVCFLDDTFPLSAAMAEVMVNTIGSTQPRKHVFLELRVDQVLSERRLLGGLGRCCNLKVFLGADFVSGSEKTRFAKGSSDCQVADAIDILHQCGAATYVGIVLGATGQMPDELAMSMEYCERFEADGYYPVFYQPYPGVADYARAVAAGHIPPRNLLDVASQDWLRLDENLTNGIARQELIDAFCRIKTMTLHRSSRIREENMVDTCILGQYCLAIESDPHNSRRRLRQQTETGLVTIWDKLGGMTISHSSFDHVDCVVEHLIMLGRLASCHLLSNVGGREYGVIGVTLEHPHHFVRAVAVWSLGKLIGEFPVLGGAFGARVTALQSDEHAFARSMAIASAAGATNLSGGNFIV